MKIPVVHNYSIYGCLPLINHHRVNGFLLPYRWISAINPYQVHLSDSRNLIEMDYFKNTCTKSYPQLLLLSAFQTYFYLHFELPSC